MSLKPKKTKFRKSFKGNININALERKVVNLAFGKIGIKILRSVRIRANQLEALRKCLMKILLGRSKFWLRIFPNIPATLKPIEVRMGKGKGNVEYWYGRMLAGRILFEFTGLSTMQSNEILKLCKNKLSIPLKLVYK